MDLDLHPIENRLTDVFTLRYPSRAQERDGCEVVRCVGDRLLYRLLGETDDHTTDLTFIPVKSILFSDSDKVHHVHTSLLDTILYSTSPFPLIPPTSLSLFSSTRWATSFSAPAGRVPHDFV